MKYLLNVTFFAGSDNSPDVDKGLYLLTTKDKNIISENGMKDIFKKVNKLCNPFSEDYIDGFPTYDEGLNIGTLIEGIKMYTDGVMTKLESNNELPQFDTHYDIEQWW